MFTHLGLRMEDEQVGLRVAIGPTKVVVASILRCISLSSILQLICLICYLYFKEIRQIRFTFYSTLLHPLTCFSFSPRKSPMFTRLGHPMEDEQVGLRLEIGPSKPILASVLHCTRKSLPSIQQLICLICYLYIIKEI